MHDSNATFRFWTYREVYNWSITYPVLSTMILHTSGLHFNDCNYECIEIITQVGLYILHVTQLKSSQLWYIVVLMITGGRAPCSCLLWQYRLAEIILALFQLLWFGCVNNCRWPKLWLWRWTRWTSTSPSWKSQSPFLTSPTQRRRSWLSLLNTDGI